MMIISFSCSESDCALDCSRISSCGHWILTACILPLSCAARFVCTLGALPSSCCMFGRLHSALRLPSASTPNFRRQSPRAFLMRSIDSASCPFRRLSFDIVALTPACLFSVEYLLLLSPCRRVAARSVSPPHDERCLVGRRPSSTATTAKNSAADYRHAV
jgi:hypothetical protein